MKRVLSMDTVFYAQENNLIVFNPFIGIDYNLAHDETHLLCYIIQNNLVSEDNDGFIFTIEYIANKLKLEASTIKKSLSNFVEKNFITITPLENEALLCLSNPCLISDYYNIE